MFAAANTMYAAVSSRTREIGTMRALGFSRFDILVSFLGESVLLCTLGGVLGLLATIPLSYVTVSTIVNFAETVISFRFGPLVMAVALVMTLAWASSAASSRRSGPCGSTWSRRLRQL